ncbi:MAG: hypothetical protein IGS49_21855 [Chlorogloeopsis fritschii C42_A2020_084]|nr:hypothetical protein [Chlorogloeopsis fritschii]MBF2008013.1 hypothetical protein [Chlorogloeopsis fritschii C42_A2020_084]
MFFNTSAIATNTQTYLKIELGERKTEKVISCTHALVRQEINFLAKS